MVWKTQERKGRSIATNPVLFTADSKFFFGTAENQINLYPTIQKGIIRVLIGHTDLVTSLALDPNNPQLLFSASIDGTIKVWNFVTSTLLHSQRIGHPILELQYDSSSLTLYYVFQSSKKLFQLGSSAFVPESHQITKKTKKEEQTLSFDQFPRGMILTPSKKYLIFVCGRKLLVYRISDSALFCYYSKISLLCLAVSTTDRVAVGNARGEVFVFLGLLETLPLTTADLVNQKSGMIERPFASLPCNKIHWHAFGVNCLTFAEEGEAIASGGSEEALSIYHIQSGRQNFYSKIGSFLRSVVLSPDEMHFAICVSDNVIRVYDASKRLCVKTITGFKHDPHQGVDWKGTLTFYPRSSGGVSISGRSSLQGFDIAKETSLLETKILSAEGMTPDESLKVSVPLFAYNFDGTSLVTIDSRTLNSMENETSLKFWSLDGKHRNYVLNTSVTDSILGIQYTSLSFNPKHEMVLTTNSKGRFHVWDKDLTKGLEEESWYCKWSGEYKRQKSNCGCWSEDGSLFAVGFGNSLTIWNSNHPDKVQAELIHPRDETVNRATFISRGPFIVTCTDTHVYLWNLFTLTIQWSFSAPCVHLAADSTGRFVIYIQKTILESEKDEVEVQDYSNGRYLLNKPEYIWKGQAHGHKEIITVSKIPLKRTKVEGNLVLFSSKSPIPLAVWNTGSDPVQSIAFQVEKHTKITQSTIAYITKSQEVFSIEEIDVDNSLYQPEQPVVALKPLDEEEEINLLDKRLNILSTEKISQVEPAPEKSHVAAFASLSASVFNGVWSSYPVHALPLPSSLYASIMDNLVKKKVSDIQTNEVHDTKSNGIQYSNGNHGESEDRKEYIPKNKEGMKFDGEQFNTMIQFFKEMDMESSNTTTLKKRERDEQPAVEKQNGKAKEKNETKKSKDNHLNNSQDNQITKEKKNTPLKSSKEIAKDKETPTKKAEIELKNSSKKIKRKVESQ